MYSSVFFTSRRLVVMLKLLCPMGDFLRYHVSKEMYGTENQPELEGDRKRSLFSGIER
jgi:hypothetical protein